MTLLPVANVRKQYGDLELNITARYFGETEKQYYPALIARTIKMYQYIGSIIANDQKDLPADHNKSVEELIAKETGFTFDPFSETRVTVFDWNHKLGLTIHSDTRPQDALDIYWLLHGQVQNAPQSSATPPPAGANSTQVSSTQTASIAGVVAVNGKSKAKELATGQQFSMRIVQVAAAMSKTGILTYELYCAYGGKPGQYPDLLVYSDNEHAVNSGLVGKLAALGLKAGGSMAGAWFVVGNVYESNGKKGLNVSQLEVVQA